MYTTIIHPITGEHKIPKGDTRAEAICLYLIYEKPFLFICNSVSNKIKECLRYRKKKIPRPLRIKCFKKNKYRCVYCGGYKNLSADHIVPESKGGKLILENLQTLCRSCNSRKGARYE
jgi:5-methylcytosine-specific restriction endonuclease McrA